MQIKLQQLFTSWNALQKLASFDIDASSAIRLQRFMVAAKQEYDIIESQRFKLVHKYGITENDTTKVPKDKEPDFWAEFNLALDQTVSLYDPQLSSSILDGQRISASDFFALMWLLDRNSDHGLIEPEEVTNAALG